MLESMVTLSRGRLSVRLLAVLVGMVLWSTSWWATASASTAGVMGQVAAMSAAAHEPGRSDLAPAQLGEAEDIEREDDCAHPTTLAPPRVVMGLDAVSHTIGRAWVHVLLHGGHGSLARQRGPPRG